LRDADEWQRWANLQVQEELCKEMEALKSEENLDTVGRRMRELQGRWKQVVACLRVPRAKRCGDASRPHRTKPLLERPRTFRPERRNAARTRRKKALCERAEALADSSDWVKTASEIQGLQAEWKKIGPVSRGTRKRCGSASVRRATGSSRGARTT